MADLDLPPAIARIWTKYPSISNLSREEMAEAAAFVEQWERGFLSLDNVPSSVRQDLISYLCSLVNRTRQVGYRDPGVNLDGEEVEVEDSGTKNGKLLKRVAAALSGRSRRG